MKSERQSPYSFSVLRYVHDPVTQEFANIGVAVYSPEQRYLNARCEIHYGRITKIFGKIDGERFRQATRYIQERVKSIGQRMNSSLPFEGESKIDSILATVLPPDDSSLQFAASGTGLSANLDATLEELFQRLVARYWYSAEPQPRSDEDVWRKIYREPLERRHVVPALIPKTIISPNFSYEFNHSWKNERWHVYEPVSFDLLEANSILDKANRWLGRGTNLAESKEQFKLYLLLGEPQDPALKEPYVKAQNILNKMPSKPELIREHEAEDFAQEVAMEIATHDQKEGDPR
jgi:hypothetical protein